MAHQIRQNIQEILDIPEEEYINIIEKANRDWPDDYVMKLHMKEEQIDSFRKL